MSPSKVEEPPTVEELLHSVKSLTSTNGTFQQAWKNSFPDKFHCCEQGGFIYIDFPIHRPIKKVYVQMSSKGMSMNQRTEGPNASIDLNRPGINRKNVILVANFHTHPLSELVQGRAEPSTSDMNNAYYRGLPGIVISRKGIYAYGPTERNGTSNPKGYAPSVTMTGVPRPRLVINNHPPWTVDNQWPEGTGVEKPRTRELGIEEEKIEIPGLEKGKEILARASHLLDKIAPHRHHGSDKEQEVQHDDVILVEWSDEGVEYGEHLEEHAHD
ncbi:hypothetical protein JR316_0000397 [Psilocybe cubensis]|uniref:Uncharacterized protein n=2 Tax=Psilocybe cubensis TaxID=181762 RepID=A0ACB8HE89_PSICU|nr:hypothetical protein JR316_0000397 [Psilocybe cubensis]KAH9486333.1 hypothetical protein JR316_0000397 [Psilocybe cubensis]